MGITKSELFTEKQNKLASLAKVLGHPARIAILEELIKKDSCITGQLVTELGLAQATISQHLREMKDAGIIKGTVEGTSVCYCIDRAKWDEIRDFFSNFFASQENDNCC